MQERGKSAGGEGKYSDGVVAFTEEERDWGGGEFEAFIAVGTAGER